MFWTSLNKNIFKNAKIFQTSFNKKMYLKNSDTKMLTIIKDF